MIVDAVRFAFFVCILAVDAAPGQCIPLTGASHSTTGGFGQPQPHRCLTVSSRIKQKDAEGTIQSKKPSKFQAIEP